MLITLNRCQVQQVQLLIQDKIHRFVQSIEDHLHYSDF